MDISRGKHELGQFSALRVFSLTLLAVVLYTVWFKMFTVMGILLFYRQQGILTLTSGPILSLARLPSSFHPCKSHFFTACNGGALSSSFLTKKMILKGKICSLCRSIFYPILKMYPWQNSCNHLSTISLQIKVWHKCQGSDLYNKYWIFYKIISWTWAFQWSFLANFCAF